jgi:hypothetical protein
MKLNTEEHLIIIHDELGKQVTYPFKSNWGCPVNSQVSLGKDNLYEIIKRVERADGTLEITVRKKT